MKRPTRGLVVVLALVACAACLGVAANVAWGWYDRHRTFEPTTPLADQCDEVPAGAKRTTLTAEDGTTLGAAVVGPEDAEVGVVLRQGASQKICEWLPWAGEVADQTGARVLLFDRRGRGSSPGEGNLSAEPGDTRVAVQRLRDDGAARVAVVASSMGNSIMFSAVPELDPAPCAVVSISAVLVSSDGHGTVDGTSPESLPDNLWLTWESQNAAIVSNVERIRASASAQDNPEPHTLPVDTMDHSRQLMLNHAEVRDFLLDAVSSCGETG
jgi:pimeloyl-ACP methyl ester carboxylesterase